ncbi:MAG: hypothetical protein RBU25_11035, partial [Lentisphaeria bacterium]|nr:hypothetical protein [Lentisphaeria bacterium]
PWLYAARQRPGLLDLSPEWHSAFLETLVSFQDASTGFWGTAQSPRCMATTTRIVEYFWGGEPLVRGDSEMPARPWLGYGGGTVPVAKAIVETVLDARSRRQAGGVDVGAWGALAYEWRGDRETDEEICSLATTRNAFVLLRLASSGLGNADRVRVERALAAAWNGVFRLCVLEDGLWKLAARDTEPTQPAFLPRILDLSPWLEEHTDRALPAPKVLAAIGEGQALHFAWSEPEAGVLSVRIFAAPKATMLGQVRLPHLVGIIEKDGTTIWNMDPVHAAGFMRDAARKRWGVDIGASPEVPLLADRLAIFDRIKGLSAGAAPVDLLVEKANDLAFYAASVNAQGEQSLLVPIEVPVLAEPVVVPPPEPVAEPAAQDPFAEPAAEPVAEPAAEPAAQDPFAEPAAAPAAEPPAQDPFAEPAEQPPPVEHAP